MSALKWGIVTAGKISHDFVTALATLPKNDHQVVAVAARNAENAKKFAELHEIPKHYGGYDALMADTDIEVVYIGALNPQHYEVAIMALDSGKHVLCEKPLCMNERQARKLIEYAKHKKLFLMEAVWSRFFPAYQYLKKQISSGALGDVQSVDVTFGFDHTNNERLTKKQLGGGTVLDMGIYTIHFSQWVFQRPPINIKATGTLNEEGCDIDMKAELHYSGGGVSKMHTSAIGFLKNTATVKGTKGQITLNNFWCCNSLIDVGGDLKDWPLPVAKHEFNFPNSCGLRYEAEAVREHIRSGLLECDTINHNESILLAKIEDEIRKQIGVKYDEDEL